MTRLGLLVFLQGLQDASEQPSIPVLPLRDAQVNGNHAAILVQANHISARANDPRLARLEVRGQVLVVAVPIRGGHQQGAAHMSFVLKHCERVVLSYCWDD
ncbi:hypothetical protein QOT17_022968 [Balamuthia mandrillaris]